MTVGTLIDLAVGLNCIDRETEIATTPDNLISGQIKYVHFDSDHNTLYFSSVKHDYLKNLDLIWEEDEDDILGKVS